MKPRAATKAPATIGDYIGTFDTEVRAILGKIRRTIRAAAPEADEVISYRMPAFRQGGILVYFAAFQRHIGMFPPVRGDAKLDQALARYRGEKGNLKFPLDEPIPYALITRIVRLRVRQEKAKAKAKAGARGRKSG